MTAQPADLYDLLKKVRYDLTACQAKISDAFRVLNELHLPDQPETTCPNCGLPFRGARTLAEHHHLSHNGPIPQHWAAIEAASLEPDNPADEKRGEAVDSSRTRAQTHVAEQAGT